MNCTACGLECFDSQCSSIDYMELENGAIEIKIKQGS